MPVRADLHIHTVLSPCGDVEMTPAAIVAGAAAAGVGVVAITDHNTTLHCREARRLGQRMGVTVLYGAEITTREEAHVVVLVDGERELDALQAMLDAALPPVRNDPAIFGHQVVVDERERVVYEEGRLLIGALDRSIGQVADLVRSVDGIMIAAHVDKPHNSVLGQLGFLPPDVAFHALELSPRGAREAIVARHPELAGHTFIRSSDAHYPEELWRATTLFDIGDASFGSIRRALSENLVL